MTLLTGGVILYTGHHTIIITKLLSGSGRQYQHLMKSGAPDYCSSLQVLHICQWVASRTYAATMDLRDSALISWTIQRHCQEPTHGMYILLSDFIFSFNRIDLPHYHSYDELLKKLTMAIDEGSSGFAME